METPTLTLEKKKKVPKNEGFRLRFSGVGQKEIVRVVRKIKSHHPGLKDRKGREKGLIIMEGHPNVVVKALGCEHCAELVIEAVHQGGEAVMG